MSEAKKARPAIAAERRKKDPHRKAKSLKFLESYESPKTKNVKTITLLKNIEVLKAETASSCFRPDLYLNGGRSCIFCNLYEHCACPIKRQ